MLLTQVVMEIQEHLLEHCGAGIIGNARSFNGSSDMVDFGASTSMNFTWNNTFTLEAWINTTQASGTYQDILGKGPLQDGYSTFKTQKLIYI